MNTKFLIVSLIFIILIPFFGIAMDEKQANELQQLGKAVDISGQTVYVKENVATYLSNGKKYSLTLGNNGETFLSEKTNHSTMILLKQALDAQQTPQTASDKKSS